MAQPNPKLIAALYDTARRLRDGAPYEWGHMGRCNCGHLVQTITRLSDHEIIRSIDYELDEWSEHARHYCGTTYHKADDLFRILDDLGFGYDDVIHLENLSDCRVLETLPRHKRYLRKNAVGDVILYMETLAGLLEAEYRKSESTQHIPEPEENELVLQ